MPFDPDPSGPCVTRYRARGIRLSASTWAGLTALRGATGRSTADLLGAMVADAIARTPIPPDARDRARRVSLANLRRGRGGSPLIADRDPLPPARSVGHRFRATTER